MPTDKSHIESFNARLRDECLSVQPFFSLADARAMRETWRVDYSQQRPHGSLGQLTPERVRHPASAHQGQRSGLTPGL